MNLNSICNDFEDHEVSKKILLELRKISIYCLKYFTF